MFQKYLKLKGKRLFIECIIYAIIGAFLGITVLKINGETYNYLWSLCGGIFGVIVIEGIFYFVWLAKQRNIE
ncbi:hypothetical protein [Amphibacillus jilinensis]|uniref:hypothetical protein n=1 Tax=Amphibacillus jilinensis TaxID=1216008 RepID=UPI00030DCE91|nr:hypothetical protein [Amphibacillus jilinensis]